jgi:5,6-dimethylbenzimidazole synthase
MTKNKQFTANEQQSLAEIIYHRRDIRGNNFLNTPLPQPILDKILQAAALAPSVGLSQPWEFVIVRDNQTKQRIADNHQHENELAEEKFNDVQKQLYRQLKLEGIKEAPINIAVFYIPSTQPILGQNSMPEMGEYSVVCAIQNMWLTARSLNVGLGWVSILNPEKIKKILNAPNENKLIAYLCLGYVKEFLELPELEILNWHKRTPLQIIDEKY